MPLSVVIYQEAGRHRSKSVCDAMFIGISKVGDQVIRKMETEYRKPEADVAVFYGMHGNLRRAFEDYRAAGRKAVYVDLGYWGRRAGGTIGRFRGYHKFAVNNRHPTAYFRNFPHDGARAAAFGLSIQPWRTKGRHILVAGMGAKAAAFENLGGVSEWERQAIIALRQVTSRPIVFRPKPSCRVSKPLGGAGFSPPEQPLAEALYDCHALVTHHSNVAVDALIAGVPTFCFEGVAAPMSLQDYSLIESPFFPEDRESWLNDVTYCQFSIPEMEMGLAWQHLKDEGIVP